MMEFFTCKPQSIEQLMSLPHLWSTVWRKDRGLSTCKPGTEQAGGLEAFSYGAAQNLEVVLNIEHQKLKIKNIQRLVSF